VAGLITGASPGGSDIGKGQGRSGIGRELWFLETWPREDRHNRHLKKFWGGVGDTKDRNWGIVSSWIHGVVLGGLSESSKNDLEST